MDQNQDMGFIDIDFGDVPDEVPLIAPGTYRGVIEKAEIRVSQKGSRYLNVQLKVLEDPEWAGTTIFDIFMFEMDFGQVALKKLLRVALGEAPKGLDPSNLIGKIVGMRINHKKGKDQNGEMKLQAVVAEYLAD